MTGSWREHAGGTTPRKIQHLLKRAKWNADHVRNDLQQFVAKRQVGKDGVLIIGGNGFLKKTHGVGRRGQTVFRCCGAF